MKPFLKLRTMLFFAAAAAVLGATVLMTYYSMSSVAVTSRDYQALSQDLFMLSQLKLTVQRSLMPPNDYLIRPDPKDKILFESLFARSQVTLDKLQALHAERRELAGARTPQEQKEYLEQDFALFEATREDLAQLHSLALRILLLPADLKYRAEGAELMDKMDEVGEQITRRLEGATEFHLKEMNLAWRALEEAYSKAKRILLVTVGVAGVLAIVMVGLVLAHANVLRQSLSRRDQINSLYEAGRRISSIEERDRLMPWVANTAATLMGSEAAGFHLLEGGRLIVGARSDGADEALYTELPLDRASPWRRIINANEPHHTGDIPSDPFWPESLKSAAGKAGFLSFLGVPLRAKDKAIGVLSVFHRNSRSFDSEEVEVLSTFADQAAVALENARLIESLKSTQYQLLQSEKMASLGQFIAGMAHEVGTPLNIISGNAEYLMEVAGDEVNVKEELQVIIQQTERITRLIQQLLDFSRPQRAIVNEPVQVNDLIKQVIGLIGPQATKNGIEISTAFQADMPSVIASSDRLQQVFLNISLNAFHAMPDGGRLTFITQTGSRELGMDAEPEWIDVFIRDTGVGIDPNDLNKIFDPFFSTKPSGEGTGLGLYVTYQVITNLGGDIKVESEVGKGTTVKVLLPISHRMEDEASEEQRADFLI